MFYILLHNTIEICIGTDVWCGACMYYSLVHNTWDCTRPYLESLSCNSALWCHATPWLGLGDNSLVNHRHISSLPEWAYYTFYSSVLNGCRVGWMRLPLHRHNALLNDRLSLEMMVTDSSKSVVNTTRKHRDTCMQLSRTFLPPATKKNRTQSCKTCACTGIY